jgi:hypothetical protein
MINDYRMFLSVITNKCSAFFALWYQIEIVKHKQERMTKLRVCTLREK